MDLLKIATEWAKAEVFSTRFFIIFAVLFLLASLGFWQMGKTEIAKAYIVPTLVVGLLILTIGVGLFYTNKMRISQFEKAYQKDRSAFLTEEIIRAEKTLQEYKTVVFKAIPIIIIISALLILFCQTAVWRASAITTLAMMTVILGIDGMAHERMEIYHKKLKAIEVKTKLNNV